jgi:excinuclease ABC subunit C
MTASALDGIPGLGDTRRKALLKQFGSLKRLAAASVDDIIEVPGVGRHTAEAVVAALKTSDPTAGLAVNTATGEIIDDSTNDQQPSDHLNDHEAAQ